MPQAAAGMRIDPPVSVPTVPSDMPVATAIAEPPLEPPGERDGSCGFLAGPKPESSVVVPKANSCRLVLPTNTAPASRSCRVTGASTVAMWSLRTSEPAVVGVPLQSIRSLSYIGLPWIDRKSTRLNSCHCVSYNDVYG